MKDDATIESVRDYWDRQPCNIRHSNQLLGTREYFDEVEQRKYFVERHIRAFAEFEKWRNRLVLEIGCGIGTDTINFARAGAAVTAVDLSDVSLRIAQERAEVFWLGHRIEFHQANVEDLPFLKIPVDYFDLVYAFGVLHHTPNPDAALEQIRWKLKVGGTLKLMLYHRWSWKRLQMLFGTWAEAQHGCPIVRTYTRRSARRLLESHGFKVTRCTVDHIFRYRVSDYLEYRYKTVWWFTWMPEPWFHALERLFGWHLLIEAVLPSA